MLVTLKKMLQEARRGRYAVGAFNVNNLESLQAVIAAAQAERSPAIISTSEGALEYAGLEILGLMVRQLAGRSRIPFVFHLDHGKKVSLVAAAIQSGFYTSVMYDGSSLPYAANVRNASRLAKLAHARRVSLEAELGAIAGIEDLVSVAARNAHLTDPKQAQEFVRRTGCDALAVAVGTSHGAYKFKGASRLDFARLAAIRRAVSVPLVLHGASGVPASVKNLCLRYGGKIAAAKGVSDGNIKRAVALGVCKVNIDTDLRIANLAGVRRFLKEEPSVIDPRQFLGAGRDLMVKVIRQKMRLLGSSRRA